MFLSIVNITKYYGQALNAHHTWDYCVSHIIGHIVVILSIYRVGRNEFELDGTFNHITM